MNEHLAVSPRQAFLTDSNEEVLNFAVASFNAGKGVALATLVDIQGGSARPLSAQMAIAEDGLYCGYIFGGCVESAVAAEAISAITNNLDRFIRLGEGSPFFDIRLPCGGGINISIHIARQLCVIQKVLLALKGRRSTSVLYSPAQQKLLFSEVAKTGWILDDFVISYRPRSRIFIGGRALEVQATAKVAEAAGYDVFTHVPNGRGLTNGIPIDNNTAVALLYHDLDVEIPILTEALRHDPFYVGALGSNRTNAHRVERLKRLGYSDAEISQIHAPIGLFPKARDAQTLALSVVAEITHARSQLQSLNPR